MRQHSEKNVTETHAVVGREIAKFITAINEMGEMPDIKAATEHTSSKVTRGRTFSQIMLDDTLEAFEAIVTDIKRQIPDFKDSHIPIEIYQQLLNARYGQANRISNAEAKQALHESIRDNVSSQIIKDRPIPTFFDVLADRISDQQVENVMESWNFLIHSMGQLFYNEESLVAERAASSMKDILSMQFNESSMDGGDGYEESEDNEVAVLRGPATGANDNLPATSSFNPKLLQLLQSAGGEDITEKVKKGKVDPIFGRTADMQNVIEVLLQKNAPHVLLHGEEGVGMTSTVTGLAKRIVNGDVPQKLRDATVISISMAKMIHENKGGPQPHEILRMILDATAKHNQVANNRIVLHVEDMGADSEQANPVVKQFATIMRSLMAHTVKHNSADLSIIFEMPEQHLEVMKKTDPLVLKTFTPVELKPLPKEDVMDFINHHGPKLASHHGVALPDGILEFLYKKTNKFMPNQQHPGKDIAVLDNALARAVASGRKQITEDDIVTIIAKHALLPKPFVSSEMPDRIDSLEQGLLERIFGQDHVVKRIADTIGLVNEGLHDPKKPLGVFLLPGPTGVGKTELARSLAAILFGDEEAVISVDMGQFHDKHTIARFVGSPPGYVGFEGKSVLDEIEKRPFSVVLLDEIEKSHPEVDNALLPILDDGILTKMDGKRLNFRNAVFILTSNLGARAVEHAAGRVKLGFGEQSEQEKDADLESVREDAIKERLKPEFRNRTTIIHMNYLTPQVVEKIAHKKIREVSERLRDNKRYQDVKIEISPDALKQLMSVGYDKYKGARHMNQAVKEYISEPLKLWLKENKERITGRSATLVIDSISNENNKDGFRIKTQFPPVPAVIPPRPPTPGPG